MRVWVRRVLLAMSIAFMGVASVAFWFYYAFYLKWSGRFNGEGRYYSPEDEVVYHSDSKVDLYFAIVALGLAAACWLARRAVSVRARR